MSLGFRVIMFSCHPSQAPLVLEDFMGMSFSVVESPQIRLHSAYSYSYPTDSRADNYPWDKVAT